MNKNRKLISGLAVVLVLIAMSGCTAPKPAGLTTEQVASITENTLKAIDANDYQEFTHDFSDKMNSTFTQAQFDGLRSLLQNASGNYVSLGTPSLTNAQGYAIYRFPAKYANEIVFVTITFLEGGQKVEGLFFDSVNLRKASK
ncbi:MAG TPA: DUF3887 domain-containing protein [Anaerolineales bacterium]|nr:DUF3887 domain-containing protein [Anaerolineales bacterium]